MAPFLDERGRRLFTASEARAAGRGGVTAVATATGVARSTIGRGLAELRLGRDDLGSRIRRPGGGRKPAGETQPGLLKALGELVQSAIRGDPEAALLWVSKSQRHLARALTERGFAAGQKLVGRLLRRLGFSLQANRKTREGTSHPDRDAQFEFINARVKACQTAGQPAISVDTKKKELAGDFRTAAASCAPRASPKRSGCTISPSPSWARWRPPASTTSPRMPDGSISASITTLPPSPSRASGTGGATSAGPATPPPHGC